MTKRELSVAGDFSEFPAGRFDKDGLFSGEKFREKVLVPALQLHDVIRVKLDGTMGYGSSFLEEAFAGLVRVHKFAPAELHRRLTLESSDASLVKEIWSYVDGAGSSSRPA